MGAAITKPPGCSPLMASISPLWRPSSQKAGLKSGSILWKQPCSLQPRSTCIGYCACPICCWSCAQSLLYASLCQSSNQLGNLPGQTFVRRGKRPGNLECRRHSEALMCSATYVQPERCRCNVDMYKQSYKHIHVTTDVHAEGD